MSNSNIPVCEKKYKNQIRLIDLTLKLISKNFSNNILKKSRKSLSN